MINKLLYVFIKLCEKRIIRISDKSFLKIKYYYIFHKKLDLDNPKSLNEKLQWIKLYDRNPKYTMMVDKYLVKDYVTKMIGKEYVIPTLGIYDNYDDIDFSILPNKFVIKCTHNSGGVFVVKDKQHFNQEEAKTVIEKCLRTNFYYYSREWPYKNVKPRIIIEKFIGEDDYPINDYKLQTFNGKVGFSFVCTDREKNDVKFTFYDRNKKFIDVTQCHIPNDPNNAKLPNNYEKMVELAEKLSIGTKSVRVDFYEIKDKIYFGELTFFDSGGFGIYEPNAWDYKFGSLLNLNKDNKNEK